MSPTERYGVDWFEKANVGDSAALFSGFPPCQKPLEVGLLRRRDGRWIHERRRNLPESVRFNVEGVLPVQDSRLNQAYKLL